MRWSLDEGLIDHPTHNHTETTPHISIQIRFPQILPQQRITEPINIRGTGTFGIDIYWRENSLKKWDRN